MTKTVKTFLILGGLIIVAVVVWLAAPLFYDKRVSEDLPGGVLQDNGSELTPQATVGQPAGVVGEGTPAPMPAVGTVQVLKSGQFQGADSFHQAGGQARLVEVDGKTYVRFEDDFTVTNGPDLYVYFGKDGQYDADTNIGRLKGNAGSQNYEVPAGIDLSNYNEVWVWCRAFAVPFGHAVLN